MKMSRVKIFYLGLILVFNALPASAEDLSNYQQNSLTGNWNGLRDELANKGINTDIVYKFDVMSNLSGGIKNGIRGFDNLDLMVTIDGEKLFNSQGTTVFLHLLNNNGGNPNEDLVGSAQGIDNIEVETTTAKLYQAWVEQNLFDDKLSILVGLYDLNSEFYVTDTSLLFLHPTYGIGTDMSQSGENGPSIFPTTSVATRVKFQATKELYIQAAALDAVPGNPNRPHGTHIDINRADGALLVGEVGYVPADNDSKIALGSWYYTKKADDLFATDSDDNPLKEHNKGTYIIGEKKLYKENNKSDKGLSGFIRLGFAAGLPH